MCGGAHGRPVLVPSPAPLKFSLSHGGDLVLIAVAPVCVGVDVEPVLNAAEAAELTCRLHPEERTEIEAAPDSSQAFAFTRVWARKEAYLKGLGVGLGRDLAADNVTGDIPGWRLVDLPLASAYAGALAVNSADCPIVIIRNLLPQLTDLRAT